MGAPLSFFKKTTLELFGNFSFRKPSMAAMHGLAKFRLKNDLGDNQSGWRTSPFSGGRILAEAAV
jgi:hypothetical protein